MKDKATHIYALYDPTGRLQVARTSRREVEAERVVLFYNACIRAGRQPAKHRGGWFAAREGWTVKLVSVVPWTPLP